MPPTLTPFILIICLKIFPVYKLKRVGDATHPCLAPRCIRISSDNRDVYIALHNCNLNDVYNIKKKSIFLLDFVWIYFYDVGKYYISIALLLSPFPLQPLCLCILCDGTSVALM